MKHVSSKPGARLRVVIGGRAAMGPGKADLLQGIRDTGSIAAAGRGMRMSYKRAWQMVERMNMNFGAPLVTTAKGGKQGGGAVLTELGEAVLAHYRRMEALTDSAIADELAALREKVGDGESEG